MNGGRTRWAALCWLFAALFIVGCAPSDSVRIGIKPFPEQEILGHAMEALLVHHEIAVRPLYRCRDTYDCEHALQRGDIDVLVEYTGTALQLLGESSVHGDAEAQREELAQTYAPMGVQWLVDLGFDNGYVWLGPNARERALPLATMSDLGGLPTPLRVACPPEYVRRPRDGLFATARRYGLELAADPVIVADPLERYRRLLDGEVDIAVGYATDGNLQQMGLSVVRDDLQFFPAYAASILVREAALARVEGLGPTLQRLERAFDGSQMRALNHAAVVGGESTAHIARRFLRSKELLPGVPSTGPHASLRIAYDAPETNQAFGTRTITAVREVFPERAVSLIAEPDPIEAVAEGRARLAIAGAEDFFEFDRRGQLRRRTEAEAVAVVGRRVLHPLVVDSKVDPLAGRVGVPAGGSAQRLATAVVEAFDREPELVGSVPELLTALTEGRIDTALMLAAEGDANISDALQTGLHLGSLRAWPSAPRQLELPFLRPYRLRPHTYPGQDEPVELLSSQVLLAARSATGHTGVDAAGPAAALPASSPPLTSTQREALAEAVGIAESPDPAVPSPWSLRGPPTAAPSAPWADTLLNVFVIGFLGWLFAMVVARPR